MTFFVSCSGSDEDLSDEKSGEYITILIAAPQSNTTRADVGDPGYSTEEGEDWDCLSVIIAYTELEGSGAAADLLVVVRTVTKQDFYKLPVYSGTSYRQLRFNIKRGKIHIYGVTYSSDTELETAISSLSTKDESYVKNLTISNDYASTLENKTAKFLSVATGYYKDEDGDLAEYDVSSNSPIEGELAPKIPSMKLTRLAAKIDIQWDAQDAYTKGYTNVGVNGFTFYNTSDETESGKGEGCLFPKLYEGDETFTGQSEFLNTSDISKRNGRVYHHVFPCKGTPHVKFKLSAKKDNKEQDQDYTFQFPGEIQQATWYKVNTTIRGVTGTTTITLNN